MSRVRNFCFTWNNYPEDHEEKLRSFPHVVYLICGREVAPTTGTKHLQGYIQLDKQQTIKAYQKKLTKLGVKLTLQVAKGSSEQNKTYCSKDGDVFSFGEEKVQGERTDIAKFASAVLEGQTDLELTKNHPECFVKYYKAADRIRKAVKDEKGKEEMKSIVSSIELYEWQKEAIERLLTQNDRQVLWVSDPEGAKGKTMLSRYLVANHNAFYIQNGKNADIAYAYDSQEVIVFDLTRSQEERVNYSIIESFKNGVLFSPKYESITKMFKPCKVVVMANFYPDQTKLSSDRWDIMELS